MPTKEQTEALPGRTRPGWVLPTAVAVGLAVPLFGSMVVGSLLAGWSWASPTFHSTLEAAGASLGLALAALILFSQQRACTSRRMWIVCALISMAVLDIFHSCVPAGASFVWLHSMAVLAGGVFLALVWFPEREISRATASATAGTALLVTALIGLFSAVYPQGLPAMTAEGNFTPLADTLILTGGGLSILAALNFAVHYHRQRRREEMLFLLLCLLFGVSGVLFCMSSIWEAGWWFWHVLRFAGYLFAFWLALLTYRNSEHEMTRAHAERLVHELQVHRVELEMQNEELQRAWADAQAGLQLYAELYDAAPVGYVTLDEEGLILQANLTSAHMLGVEQARLVRQPLSRFVADEDGSAFRSHCRDVLRTEARARCDVRMRRAAGETFWASVECDPVRGQDGARIRCAVIDITAERKRAEEALSRSEQKYRELVESANSIIMRRRVDGAITFLNRFGQDFFGYSEAEIVGRNVVGTIVPPTDSNGRDLAAMVKDIGERPDRYGVNQNENMRKNGERVWVSWTNRPILDEQGRVAEILAIGNDMTRHKQMEEEIRGSERRFRAIFENAADGIILADAATNRFIMVNRAACDMLGYSKKELGSLSVADIQPKDALPLVIDAFETPAGGGMRAVSRHPAASQGRHRCLRGHQGIPDHHQRKKMSRRHLP